VQAVQRGYHLYHHSTAAHGQRLTINCTHVPIKAPAESEDAFVNGKGVHTLNIQAVCDADMKVTNVVAKRPRSARDAIIWHYSSLQYIFHNGHVQGGWLLATLALLMSIKQICYISVVTTRHPRAIKNYGNR